MRLSRKADNILALPRSRVPIQGGARLSLLALFEALGLELGVEFGLGFGFGIGALEGG